MDSREILNLSQARQVAPSRALLAIAEQQRDKIRKQVEASPKISDVIKEDFRFKLGQIAAYNWLLEQPARAERKIDSLPED